MKNSNLPSFDPNGSTEKREYIIKSSNAKLYALSATNTSGFWDFIMTSDFRPIKDIAKGSIVTGDDYDLSQSNTYLEISTGEYVRTNDLDYYNAPKEGASTETKSQDLTAKNDNKSGLLIAIIAIIVVVVIALITLKK